MIIYIVHNALLYELESAVNDGGLTEANGGT